MRTFNETLSINNTMKRLNETFFLMSVSGIDPMRFVEWYTLDGLEAQNQGLLVEAAEEWLLEGARWDAFKRGVSNVATGNVDYGAIGKGFQQGGAVVGNLATAPVAATTAAVGGLARGVIGAGAKNLAGGVMGGLGLGGNNAAPATPGAPGTPPQGGDQAKGPDATAEHMKKAHAALDTLSKRMGNSKNLAQELGGPQFQTMVSNLLHMIKNNQALQQAAPATAHPDPAAHPPVANPPVAHPPVANPVAPGTPGSASAETPQIESGFYGFTRRIKLKNEIRTGLTELQREYNIHPVAFVDWYIEEGQYLNENGVGDWFGRQFAGVGGLFNGKGYSAAGQEWQGNKDKKRDDDAVQQAMNTISNFERDMKAANANFTPDFAQALGSVRDALSKRSGGAAADPNAAAQPQDPNAAAQPQDPNAAQPQDPAQVTPADPVTTPADPSGTAPVTTPQMDPGEMQDRIKSIRDASEKGKAGDEEAKKKANAMRQELISKVPSDQLEKMFGSGPDMDLLTQTDWRKRQGAIVQESYLKFRKLLLS